MCERYGIRNVIRFAQFTIWWMEMDKRRPAIIVSGNWFNTVANGFIAASITTKKFDDTTLDKEYGQLLVPFIDSNREMSYIKLTDLRFVSKSEFDKISPNDFYGVLTDMTAMNKISELMQGIMNPAYMGYHLSTEYISNNIKIQQEDNGPDKETDNKPTVVVVKSPKRRPANKVVADDTKYTNHTVESNGDVVNRTDLRARIINQDCDEEIAIEFLRNHKPIDDRDLLINTVIYIGNKKSATLSRMLGVSPSGVSRKLHSIVNMAEERRYITPGAADFVRENIRSRTRNK